MPEQANAILSPADAHVLVGSFCDTSRLFLKGKFFDYDELLARDKPHWLDMFRAGDYAVFRLTPEKYHYNHAPVSGVVEDIYEIPGAYHSCNPGAVVLMATPCSKKNAW